MKIILAVALIGFTLATGCQHLCDVTEAALTCDWLCHDEQKLTSALSFSSSATMCDRDSFLECVQDDIYDDMCYVAANCAPIFKFGSAFYCLSHQPGNQECLTINGLVEQDFVIEDNTEGATTTPAEQTPATTPETQTPTTPETPASSTPETPETPATTPDTPESPSTPDSTPDSGEGSDQDSDSGDENTEGGDENTDGDDGKDENEGEGDNCDGDDDTQGGDQGEGEGEGEGNDDGDNGEWGDDTGDEGEWGDDSGDEGEWGDDDEGEWNDSRVLSANVDLESPQKDYSGFQFMNVMMVLLILGAVAYGVWSQSNETKPATVILPQTSPREMALGDVTYAQLSEDDVRMMEAH